ncbi:hypothetical protein JYU04_02900 [Dehalococcoides mccartyi]|nr:hypothetical protein [Dehalococcoides mccartyi]
MLHALHTTEGLSTLVEKTLLAFERLIAMQPTKVPPLTVGKRMLADNDFSLVPSEYFG